MHVRRSLSVAHSQRRRKGEPHLNQRVARLQPDQPLQVPEEPRQTGFSGAIYRREGIMTEQEALELLRAAGHAVGAPDEEEPTVRVWVHGGDHSVDVQRGRELILLAEGHLTIDQIEAKREDEHSVIG